MNKRIQPKRYWQYILVLLLLFVGSASARQVDVPSVTISGTNITLEQVLKSIEKQTGFKFQYSAQFVNIKRKVHVDVHGKPVSYVLNLVLGDKLKYKFSNKLIIISPRRAEDPPADAAAPLISVAGLITDPAGAAVIGASIFVEGTAIRTMADATGQFMLQNVQEGSLLTISCIGYQTTQAVVPDNGKLKITLDMSVTMLKGAEIVGNGYQDLARERVTGSMEKVDNKLFNRPMTTNVLDRLDGVVNGMVHNRLLGKTAKSDISIRGISTIGTQNGADAQPLIILDNFPYDGNVDNINPNDVESVTVLKDAASSSIWGARAGNGVIVIKTKQGKYNTPARVNFNSFVVVTGKPDLYSRPQFSAKDFIEIEEFLFSKNFYNSQLSNSRRPVVSPVVELLAAERAGKITHEQAQAQIDQLKEYDIRRDYEKYLYQPAVNQQYALSVDGGDKRMNYIFSLGYDKNRSSLVGDEQERITMKTFNNVRINKRLDVQTGILFTQANTENNSIGTEVLSGTGNKKLYPYARLADDAGNSLPIPRDYRSAYLDTVGGGKLLDWMYRPLDEQKLSNNKTRTNDVVLYLGANYEINKDLNIDVKYQFAHTSTDKDVLRDVRSYYTRSLINLYTPTGGSASESAIPNGHILDTTNIKSYSNNFRLQLNYSHVFGKAHSLDAILGGEIKQFTDHTEMGKLYGYTANGPVRYIKPQVISAPTYDLLAGSNAQIPFLSSVNNRVNRFLSVYSNFTYGYKSRYILTASFRRDASNLYGVATNQKWNPLWSAGAAWIISKESFYDVKWLPFLKFRTAYGYSGNSNNDVTGVVTLEGAFPNDYNDLPAQTIIDPPNPQLRWEKVKTTNLAMDISSKDNRVNVTVEYYFKLTEDLLAYVVADVSSGFDVVMRNSGSFKGKGIDISISTLNLDGDLKWKTDFLFSHNEVKLNRFDKTYNNASAYIGAGDINPIQGKPVYAITSYKSAGLDPLTGDPMGYLNGLPSKDYLGMAESRDISGIVFHGSARPQIFGSVRNSIIYKGITVSFNISYEFKYFFRNPYALNYVSLFNNWSTNGYKDYLNRWQKPGDELKTTVPSLGYPINQRRDEFYLASSSNIEKGDHVRLRDIAVDYPMSITAFGRKKTNFLLRAYANNLGIIWKKTRIDVDPSYGDPLPVSVGVGLKLNL